MSELRRRSLHPPASAMHVGYGRNFMNSITGAWSVKCLCGWSNHGDHGGQLMMQAVFDLHADPSQWDGV